MWKIACFPILFSSSSFVWHDMLRSVILTRQNKLHVCVLWVCIDITQTLHSQCWISKYWILLTKTVAWRLVIGQNHLQKPLVFPPGKFTGWWIWWCMFYGILMWLYIGGSPSLLLSLVDCWLSPILWQHNLFGGGGFHVDLLISAAFDSW